MDHYFALAPGDDVDRVLTGWQRNLVVLGSVETVLVTDVLLILVDELDIFAARILLVEDNADEIDAYGRRIFEQNIETCIGFPLSRISDAVPIVIDRLANPDLA